MTSQAATLVHARLRLLAAELGKPELAQATDDTHLLGGHSPLDSIGLVTLIADLEGDILAATGKSVTLADEKAMSRTLSPFRQVRTLIEYVEARLGNAS